MKENIKEIYTRHRKWLLPIIVGVAVFLISQTALVLLTTFTDNPLPVITGRFPVLRGDITSPLGNTPSQELEARVVIDRLGIDVPIVWSESTNEAALQIDLQSGALRYPGTPEPGVPGNSFITAHSSDYPWSPGEYKQAFMDLGDLEVGDEDIRVVYYEGGQPAYQAIFKATLKEVVKPTDRRMIEQGDKTEMTLVTCWPIGTAWRRLMVKTELVEIQEI